MNIRVRRLAPEEAVSVKSRLPEVQREAGRLERRHVRGLVGGVGDLEVDVDHGPGRETRDAGGPDVVDAERGGAEGRADAGLQVGEVVCPGGVVVHDVQAAPPGTLGEHLHWCDAVWGGGDCTWGNVGKHGERQGDLRPTHVRFAS